MAHKTLMKIVDGFKAYPQVVAVALGGSRAAGTDDSDSDIDLEVFVKDEIPVEKRFTFLRKFSSDYEIGCDYFGSGDELFVDEMKQKVDIAYFRTSFIENEYNSAFRKVDAKNGYTTCFLFTISNCQILYDRYGWLQGLKDKIDVSYPKLLKENIIKRNLMLLKDKPFFSYYEQIEKAISRNDINSINHRIAAFMASYFDIIFANNELLHPGEKKLIDYALKNCKKLPRDFQTNIQKLLTQPNPDTLKILDDMINKLRIGLKK